MPPPGLLGVVETNVAVTLLLESIVTVHELLWPVHAPDQPLNVLPAPAAAVSVTGVPLSYVAEHKPPGH